MSQSIRVGLIDWDLHVRSGRKLFIEATANLDLVYEAVGSESDVDEVLKSLIDVLVIEQRLGGWSGIEMIHRLRQNVASAFELPKLIVTAPFETDQLLLQAFEAGANSVVSLEGGHASLLEAIEQSNTPGISTSELFHLIRNSALEKRVDLSLRTQIDSLPPQNKQALKRLSGAFDSDRTTDWGQLDLDNLAKALEIRELPELVIRAYLSGLLDGE